MQKPTLECCVHRMCELMLCGLTCVEVPFTKRGDPKTPDDAQGEGDRPEANGKVVPVPEGCEVRDAVGRHTHVISNQAAFARLHTSGDVEGATMGLRHAVCHYEKMMRTKSHHACQLDSMSDLGVV